MNWQDIRVSFDHSHFLLENRRVFEKEFIEVLNFHHPGIAAVKDLTGSYHIDSTGKEIYALRYQRTFGFYCGRAAVVLKDHWFHIDEHGERVYRKTLFWAGNFQENLCTVKDGRDYYFHIDLKGDRVYSQHFIYAGDFKDRVACVKTENGLYRHINTNGEFINGKAFLDLGVFHKNFAIAKDEYGWFHINKNGEPLYNHRFVSIEPFYNGFAVVESITNQKQIIDEQGNTVLWLDR